MALELTRDQIQSRKDKAERFLRDVKGDDDRADEVAEESIESYAERRKIRILNPRGATTMPSKEELQQRIAELEEENEDLKDALDQVADIVAPPDDEEDDADADDENGDDDVDDSAA